MHREADPTDRSSGMSQLLSGGRLRLNLKLSCSKGRARWTLALLEDKVVELNIVDRASDNTIGRTLKRTFSNRI